MLGQLHLPPLTDNPAVAKLTYDEVQTRLAPLWKSIERMNQDELT